MRSWFINELSTQGVKIGIVILQKITVGLSLRPLFDTKCRGGSMSQSKYLLIIAILLVTLITLMGISDIMVNYVIRGTF